MSLSATGPQPVFAMPILWMQTILGDLRAALLEPDEEGPEHWMARYQAGDSRAFEKLYEALAPRLFGYLLRLTRDRSLAEDIVQITFAKVHRARASFLSGERVLPWMFAIARRSFLDEKRRAHVKSEELSRDGRVPEEASASSDEADLAEEIDAALAQLPESYAEAIQLTKLSGLSLREAASVLGTSEAAVKLRVHRGYEMLRKTLERRGA